MTQVPLAERLRPRHWSEVVDRAQQAACGLVSGHTLEFVDEVHRFNKAVNHYINQQLRKVLVQFFVLSRCSMGVKHG